MTPMFTEFDLLEQKHSNGELCFIRWPYMTVGDMNDKLEFYAERDEWNATAVGASTNYRRRVLRAVCFSS